jgi:hypothetical protein
VREPAPGWYRTGDLGYRRDGWVHVVDRLEDVVLRGGENLYGVQVENALHEIDWAHEAAVYGVPHPNLGEEAAAVHTAPDAPRDEEYLRRWVVDRVAAFAAPTHVVWFDTPLPRTATGKVLGRELREQHRGSRISAIYRTCGKHGGADVGRLIAFPAHRSPEFARRRPRSMGRTRLAPPEPGRCGCPCSVPTGSTEGIFCCAVPHAPYRPHRRWSPR